MTDDAIVKFPSRNLLLLHKADALLGRKNAKCRDAFDIKVLRDSGAELNGSLKFHLQDGIVSDRLEDPDFISQRIAAVTQKRCSNSVAIRLGRFRGCGNAARTAQPVRDEA
jgi:hypothetical protein